MILTEVQINISARVRQPAGVRGAVGAVLQSFTRGLTSGLVPALRLRLRPRRGGVRRRCTPTQRHAAGLYSPIVDASQTQCTCDRCTESERRAVRVDRIVHVSLRTSLLLYSWPFKHARLEIAACTLNEDVIANVVYLDAAVRCTWFNIEYALTGHPTVYNAGGFETLNLQCTSDPLRALSELDGPVGAYHIEIILGVDRFAPFVVQINETSSVVYTRPHARSRTRVASCLSVTFPFGSRSSDHGPAPDVSPFSIRNTGT
ncbi:hypothetical protein EVAR_58794_1 [Eumeta japonica]|uniref:Uncharacterized protein n=1 Tax=Eumeta variegata TaxID=151549 RepID=A0A4C1YJR2_EUMVA|nr:hypothetical protein EVAR_58794_1 [Eumeta japonica]